MKSEKDLITKTEKKWPEYLGKIQQRAVSRMAKKERGVNQMAETGPVK